MAIWVVKFSNGGVKLERSFLQNQYTQRKFLNFENWLIISSSIVYGAEIEISGTKWVEKTPIYVFSTFSSKINEFEQKKLEKKNILPYYVRATLVILHTCLVQSWHIGLLVTHQIRKLCQLRLRTKIGTFFAYSQQINTKGAFRDFDSFIINDMVLWYYKLLWWYY